MQPRTAELRSALRKGLGRAAVLLREAPDGAEVQAELLHACTTNLVFDKQCEEGRAPYLHRLIGIAGQADRFRGLLWKCLRAAAPGAACSDLLPADLERLAAVLERLAADEIAHHDVGGSVLDVIGRVGGQEERARGILLHLYEHGPCPNCRKAAVDELAATSAVPAWMAEEARFDAVPDIAERFAGPAVG